MVMKTVHELFGIPADIELEVGDQPIAPKDGGVKLRPNYKFRKSLVRSLLAFWDLSDEGGIYRAALLHGPKGSGKTTLVEQWHCRLNLPLLVTTGNGKLEPDDLIGSQTLDASGAVVWQDGVLLQAARRGCSVLINEINTIEPDILSALNDICQPGSTFVVPRTGEVINPAPGFRVFATCNPAGGLYMGRKEVDPATKRRFFNITCSYPEPAEEKEVLLPIFINAGVEDDMAGKFADRLIKVANAIRARSVEVSTAPDAIPETLSTDELIKWATVWIKLQGTPNALTVALDHVLLSACEAHVRQAIQSQVVTVFGAEA